MNSVRWKRVFPFDTGAFPDRYQEFFHIEMGLDDFVLPGDCESARRVVEAFFASNADYFDARAMATHRAAKTIETAAYHELLRAFGGGRRTPGDDRLVTVEMQANGEVALDAGNIETVIVPDRALELEDVRTALERCGVPFDTYRTGALSLVECQGNIYEKVRQINGLG